MVSPFNTFLCSQHMSTIVCWNTMEKYILQFQLTHFGHWSKNIVLKIIHVDCIAVNTNQTFKNI